MARDVVGELLDEKCLADHDLLDRLLEQLREAGHVDALLGRIQIDRALDLGGDEPLDLAPAEPDRLAETAHTGARQPDLDVGGRRLEILEEVP